MQFRGLEPRVVAVATVLAALSGLMTAALILAIGDRPEEDNGLQTSVRQQSLPPFIVLSPTSTPKPDHPSPDLGNLVGARVRGGKTILSFDRVTVRGSQQTGYTIDNKSPRRRSRALADQVKVIGTEKLARHPAPKAVPLQTLLDYVEESAAENPLLVWLYYGEGGKVVEIREQNLP